MLKKLIERKLEEFDKNFCDLDFKQPCMYKWLSNCITEASKEAIKQTKFNKRCELCCAARVCYGFCDKALEEQQKRITKYLTQ